jgi:hypothetical protein
VNVSIGKSRGYSGGISIEFRDSYTELSFDECTAIQRRFFELGEAIRHELKDRLNPGESETR